MMIGPDVDSLTEQERYFNPTYLVVAPGKEYLRDQLIRASVCDCDTTIPNRRIGIFSVAKNKQVSFSQGNLQYLPAANLWKFANTQYEYLGNSNKYLSPTYRNWVDLFGWSGEAGISFLDWGVNEICGDATHTWRTLSTDEWKYLLHDRKYAADLLVPAVINNTLGLVVLPDEWTCPAGVQLVSISQTSATWDESRTCYDYSENIYLSNLLSVDIWQRLENAGAVFLPASGYINKDGQLNAYGTVGRYWSATPHSHAKGYYMSFGLSPTSTTNTIRTQSAVNADKGHTVRLVHDTIVPPPAPCETITVNGVNFNMMCVEGGTFMMGEGRSDAHQVTLSDYYIGETEVTQAQWKAIMGNVPTGLANYGDTYPVANISLADCRLFVERLSELTGRYFRIPTEAEWEYAARGGKHCKGFAYAGSDDINEVAWYVGNKTEHKPKPVKCFKPNELGIYDMSGNMGEWVSDWNAPYNLYPQVNPTGAAIHSTPGWPYTYRGGAWGSDANNCTPTSRQSHQRATYAIGLRIVMSDEEPFRAVYINDTTRFYLRPVKKGTFMMGSREDDPIIQQNLAAKADELPQHKVTLDSDYWVAEYEVTQALWTAVMGTDVHDMHAALSNSRPEIAPVWVGPAYPMYYVYTADVFEFTRRLSKMTGLNFRLPTEAEWEYAARGAHLSHGYLYAGSNDVDSVAWYAGSNSGLQPVGLKKPNELGIYDLSGNVLERCVDYLEYHQPYDPNDTLNPRGKIKESGNRAYRGGAQNMHKDSARVTHRAPQTPTYTSHNVGTRVVVNDEHYFETFKVGGVWFDMIFVKGGTFMMGAAADDTTAETDEKPQHSVTLSDYYIGQTEVSQWLWRTVMGSNPSTFKGDKLPVENVTWAECQTFVAKLSQMTGYNFRLPTEAEWEFAARGGNKSKDFVYAGSDNIDEVAWHIGNSGNMTHPVATKQPNELGIYDMSGNVWELCQDWNGPYTADAQVNPQGPNTGEYRMYRGGGWKYADKDCRVTRRRQTASYDKTSLGLRLVLDKHAYVDLGLSVLWATTNVGAEQPEEYGDYYAWGETETKDFYGWSTYKWCKGTDTSLTKYCTNAKYGADGFTDGLTTLQPEDDAAHVHWGAMWRMASRSEFQELIDNCRWETTTLNGVKGYRVTSSIPGYTDRSIFLPMAGFLNHDIGNSQKGTTVRYWSSTGNNTSASNLHEAKIEGNTRRIGMSIRPVLPTDRTNKTPKTEPAKRIGVFSVGAGKHVTFSQGNLIYLKLKDKWLFAPNQLYCTGERHLQNGQIADTVMYFGWSAKDSKAPWGISTSINLDYYKGEFLDWGTNKIQGDKPNTWRTMTDDEVLYLLEGRKNAVQLIGFAEVEGIKGMIILPDDWQLPEGLNFTPFDGTIVNHYTIEQWQQMESIGAVIIPAAGYFNNKLSPKMRDVNTQGYMPYSVLLDSLQQQYSYLDHDKILHRWPSNNNGNLFYAFPRRLVHDTVVPEYVDMGLSVKWANYNLGASTPTGVGDYYAWGEIEPKDSYTTANYQWANGVNALTKYCTVDSMGYNGFTDGLTTLQAQDDAAQMQKGGHWRMPSDAEWEELRKNCIWTQAEQGGQIGYIATSKINGNRIFIPVAGFRSGGNVVLDYLGAYWSSKLNEAKQSCAYGLYINKDEDRVGKYSNSTRSNGFLIRPVYDENYHAYIDLGLSVYWAMTNVGANFPEQYGDYFAWGETEPKDNYDWSTYKWCDGTKSSITKYNATDGLTTLLPEDDAAYVNWGREWRMPTEDELTELRTSCTWESETKDGVKGAKVTGPNGNSIFIPLGGSYNTFDDQLNSVGSHGWIYSATKASVDNQAKEMGVSSSGAAQTSCSRCLGLNIRPVIPKPDDGKYRYGLAQQYWDECNGLWGHGGRGHAVQDQSPLQGTIVRGVRLNVGRVGSLNIYKVPSLLETTEDHFELVATITTDSLGVQDIDFPVPVFVGENEYLVFGKPSETMPTLTPMYNTLRYDTFKQNLVHFIGTDKVKTAGSALMVDFY